MTSMEREEKEKVKKREKKQEDEETLQQATWVKYTIPIKHQVNGSAIHLSSNSCWGHSGGVYGKHKLLNRQRTDFSHLHHFRS